jgi:site-specific recombinase XerD
MEPQQAVEEYIESRKYSDTAQATIQNYTYRLKRFIEFCDRAGIEDIGNVTGRTAEKYKQARLKNSDVSPYTVEQQLRTFRLFIRWCEASDLIIDGVSDKLVIPQVDTENKVRNEAINADRAEKMIEYLQKHEYAEREHVVFHLMWHTGMRLGSVRALDLKDLDLNRESCVARVRHRPERGTPLKMKGAGERNVTIADDDLVEAIQDYIDVNRPPVEDEFGREPLVASDQVRLHKTGLRETIYKVVRPCYYSGDCPHDREIAECEATSTSIRHPRQEPPDVSCGARRRLGSRVVLRFHRRCRSSIRTPTCHVRTCGVSISSNEGVPRVSFPSWIRLRLGRLPPPYRHGLLFQLGACYIHLRVSTSIGRSARTCYRFRGRCMESNLWLFSGSSLVV